MSPGVIPNLEMIARIVKVEVKQGKCPNQILRLLSKTKKEQFRDQRDQLDRKKMEKRK